MSAQLQAVKLSGKSNLLSKVINYLCIFLSESAGKYLEPEQFCTSGLRLIRPLVAADADLRPGAERQHLRGRRRHRRLRRLRR